MLRRPFNAISNASRSFLGACALGSLLLACSSNDAPSGNPITIGLLLPFTGTNSATASNFERAALSAADRINAAGGVKGRQLRVVSGDTHSDLARSQASAQQLIDAGAVIVIGPESAEVATAIIPLLVANHVAFLSPVVGAANDETVDCTHPWFRLAPSARALGEALAKLASARSVTSISVLAEATAYDEALRDAVTSRFVSLGGTVKDIEQLSSTAQSYSTQVQRATEARAGAIVLAASPRTGALIVNEFDSLSSTPPKWFLSPLLQTDLLVQNVAPSALEGGEGVAPKIYDTSGDFPDWFSQRWAGDLPLAGAFFYYDAVALASLALEKSTLNAKGGFDLDHIEAAVLDAASPPGAAAGWSDIADGLARQHAGEDIYYSGLTGPMLLDSCGNRRLGVTSDWSVHNGQLVDE